MGFTPVDGDAAGAVAAIDELDSCAVGAAAGAWEPAHAPSSANPAKKMAAKAVARLVRRENWDIFDVRSGSLPEEPAVVNYLHG
ncbi:hypothetical protein [Pseudonocardia xinjiangensis]|uniref:Alpha/beta hydrolase n=1 Tax=Pseudonocardia xinjiangensis TaxID=75289 RepID=A0ABX1RIV0_9PSEU|nr:hypothetical protein [Pseudonocardia xinjiangensis]NMH80325.1 hypothetical protein [Pseudonocardia xinjiangensis]